MKINNVKVFLFGVAHAGLVFLTPVSAHADCDLGGGNGTRSVGKVVYNVDYDVFQVCRSDGVWQAISPIGCPAGNGCPADPCAGSPNPGDVCADGSYYIGQIGGNDIYATAAASQSSQSWNNGTSNYTVTGFTSTTDGPGNTAGLVASADAGAPYDAAEYCDGLTNVHGHSDWYLPAKDELNLFWNGGSPVAGVLTGGSNWYWSSSEDDNSFAWLQGFSDGGQFSSLKYTSLLVRCVRR